jgi:hypothetical protein
MTLPKDYKKWLDSLSSINKQRAIDIISIIFSYKELFPNSSKIPADYFQEKSLSVKIAEDIVRKIINKEKSYVYLIKDDFYNGPSGRSIQYYRKLIAPENLPTRSSKDIFNDLFHGFSSYDIDSLDDFDNFLIIRTNDEALQQIIKYLKSPAKSSESFNIYDKKIAAIMPDNINWENITIKLTSIFDIEIFIDKKSIVQSNYEKMGFAKKNSKNKTPKESWNFLKTLSTNKGRFNLSTDIIKTKGNLVQAKEKYKQTKKQLSDILKQNFGLEAEPFFDCKEKGLYQTKFTLIPPPDIRGDGELYHTNYLP